MSTDPQVNWPVTWTSSNAELSPFRQCPARLNATGCVFPALPKPLNLMCLKELLTLRGGQQCQHVMLKETVDLMKVRG